jgi:hypothetical protein
MNKVGDKKYKLTINLSLILIVAVFFFGLTYWLVGFIENNGIYSNGIRAGFWESIYFSVVTITTLGYGDFTPLGISRFLVSFESIFGLIFIGYGISQVLSVRQEAVVEYIANNRIFQTYNECIVTITEAKESIGDRRRFIKHKGKVDPIDFIYNKANPFYPALKAIQTINGYTSHIEEIDKTNLLEKHIERASHHVEELMGFTRKYITILEVKGVTWRTPRTKQILIQLCDAADLFIEEYIPYTKYQTETYKGGGSYKNIVSLIVKDIRLKCSKTA